MNVGHAWVVDGYDTNNAFHCNWGWGGTYNDTWYYLTDLTPGSHNYNTDQHAIIGAEPILDACSGLSGSSLVCSSNESYSVTVPTLASVEWSKNGNLTPVGGNTGTTYTVTQAWTSGGSGGITATIRNSHGQTFLTRSKTVWAGPPHVDYLDLNANFAGNNLLMPGDDNQIVGRYDGPDCGTILDYNWGSWSGWNHFEVGTSNFISYFSVPYDFSTSEDIYVSAVNACGESPNHFKTFYPIQYFYFSIYPNPATDYIQLSIEPESEVQDKTSKVKIAKVKGKDGLGEYSIEIWSEKGGRLKTLTSKDMCQQVSTRDLPTGKYFVHVIVDGKTYKQQLIVAK